MYCILLVEGHHSKYGYRGIHVWFTGVEKGGDDEDEDEDEGNNNEGKNVM